VIEDSMVLVRYFAGARAAAGCAEEKVTAATLGDLIDVIGARHGDRLAVVLRASSFLVDGLAGHDRTAALPEGATVDVLPPFAGG
jgi:molybdopterin converting factor small subunit